MRSIISLLIMVTIAVSATIAYAAQTAGITVPQAGDHYYWFVYTDIHAKQVTTTPVGFKDKKVMVDLPLVKDAVPAKCMLYVLDAKTGNEAVLPVVAKAGQLPKLDVKSSSFDRVRRVDVLVTSATSRQPAAAAVVKLDDGEGNVQSQIIDPSLAGIAEFTDVPSGTVKVEVQYGDGKTSSQDIDVPLDREGYVVPKIDVPVAGQIDTVEAASGSDATSGGDAAKSSDKASKPAEGPGINFPTAFVGLILFVGIVWAAVRVMGNKGAGLVSILKKFGVDVKDDPEPVLAPSQPAQGVQVDPSICPFCGGKKDPATGACACSVGAGSTPGASSAGSGPRLVATQGVYAGNIYPLEAGAITIGRDESNPVAFSQDSTVSRKHARVSGNDGEFTIADEGSSNGTFVNGVKVTEQVLHSGDEIQIGNTRMRFEI